jgi:scyllo-inositol 2-dehydrogenase (NADP+)
LRSKIELTQLNRSGEYLIRVALIGLGKMGLSHHAIIKTHPKLNLVAVCDVSDYILSALNKYTGIRVYSDYGAMLQREQLDAIFIASPSRLHGAMIRAALDRGLHVFCEKPLCLDPQESVELASLAESKGLITQVGYHYRFVATFAEMKRLVEKGAIGEVHNARAEAYGPVVVRAKVGTWRSSKDEGGGCLFDYSCHAIDLLNYLFGPPKSVCGTVLNSVFSRDVDDETYTTLRYASGMNAQIAANWSDESVRKMSMKVSLWGTKGRLIADRQELSIYLRTPLEDENLRQGWNTRFTTDLTKEVWFYLRGEEYSAQIDHFANCIETKSSTLCSFRSASQADVVAAMMISDAAREVSSASPMGRSSTRSGLWGLLPRRER